MQTGQRRRVASIEDVEHRPSRPKSLGLRWYLCTCMRSMCMHVVHAPTYAVRAHRHIKRVSMSLYPHAHPHVHARTCERGPMPHPVPRACTRVPGPVPVLMRGPYCGACLCVCHTSA